MIRSLTVKMSYLTESSICDKIVGCQDVLILQRAVFVIRSLTVKMSYLTESSICDKIVDCQDVLILQRTVFVIRLLTVKMYLSYREQYL